MVAERRRVAGLASTAASVTVEITEPSDLPGRRRERPCSPSSCEAGQHLFHRAAPDTAANAPGCLDAPRPQRRLLESGITSIIVTSWPPRAAAAAANRPAKLPPMTTHDSATITRQQQAQCVRARTRRRAGVVVDPVDAGAGHWRPPSRLRPRRLGRPPLGLDHRGAHRPVLPCPRSEWRGARRQT
jgi:hypothetical protein